jgi:N-acetylneuraminic acid mutarotase
MTCVVNNDTAYLISGSKGIFRFDIPSTTWVRLGDAPSQNESGIAFSLNGKIYYGLSTGGNGNFWEYDPVNRIWILKSQFPEILEQHPVAFTINNIGYALFYDNKLYSYNPLNDRWTRLSSYPGPGISVFGRTAFTMNSLGYILGGTESSSEQAYPDFWSYNPVTDSWLSLLPIPGGGRYNAVSFSINNKGYFGFGWSYPMSGFLREQYDFYEYDPEGGKK